MIFTSQINYTCSTYVLQSARAFPWNPFFDPFKKLSRDSVVTDSDSFNVFPQIDIPFNFSQINHRPLVVMDGCSNCLEINTVSLTYESLQVLQCNNDSIIDKMDSWKWSHHVTDFSHYMHVRNKGCIKIIFPCYNSCSAKTQQIWNNVWQQLLFYDKNHRMDGCSGIAN